jgi:hypothetical protein
MSPQHLPHLFHAIHTMHANTFPAHLSEPLSKPARWRLFALTCVCLAGSVAQAQTPAAKDDPVAKPGVERTPQRASHAQFCQC